MKREQSPDHETLDPIPGTLKSYLLTIKEHRLFYTKKGRRELFNLLLRTITLITSGK